MPEKLGASLAGVSLARHAFNDGNMRGAPVKRTVVFSAGVAAERKIIQSQSEEYCGQALRKRK